MTPRQREALRRARRLAVRLDNVRGVDFGLLYRGDRLTGHLGIRFHVERKLDPTEIKVGQQVPRQIDRVPCDVVQASYTPHASRSSLATFDPLQPGASFGNFQRRSAGTIGALVRDRLSGQACALSNWHVICAHMESDVGEEIIQPARRYLGSSPKRRIGSVLRWAALENGYDAALALLDESVVFSHTPLGINDPIGPGLESLVGMKLVKSGAASGITYGLVDGTDGTYLMDYRPYGGGRLTMRGVRIIPDPDHPSEEVSLKGDSGAMWIERDSGRAVALNFGGEDDLTAQYEYALAHPVLDVSRTLEFDF